jgi:hypothetical protein
MSVFSLGPEVDGEELAGRLTNNWTGLEEAAYIAGDTVTAAPTARDHDAFRGSERFRRVFQEFKTFSLFFDYGGGAANPVFDAAGNHEGSEDKLQLDEVGTLAKIPLKVGFDYTIIPPRDNNPSSAKVEYLPILAWIDDTRLRTYPDKHYVLVNQLSSVNPEYPGVGVRALENDIGVQLRSSPRHLFALGNWGGAEPTQYDPDTKGFFWLDLVVTLAVETDNRVFIERELPEELQAGDGSIKEISVPTAQYWHLSPRTVVGVEGDGTLLRSPSEAIELRNDVGLLAALIPGAIVRYIFERQRATIRRLGVIEPWHDGLGKMLVLEGEQGGLVNTKTPVTSIRWDFVTNNTTIYAGQSQR